MSVTKWLISVTDDNWNEDVTFSTREEAITEGPTMLGLTDHRLFYVARKVEPIKIPNPFEVSSILHQAQHLAFCEVGVHTSDWLENATPSEAADLGNTLYAVFINWLNINGHTPTWVSVTDVEPVFMPKINDKNRKVFA